LVKSVAFIAGNDLLTDRQNLWVIRRLAFNLYWTALCKRDELINWL